MTTASPPTMTAPTMTAPPVTADCWPAAPPGVPASRWLQAVELIRTEAAGAKSYWSLWTKCYPKFLQGHATGQTFYQLFDLYQAAGGRGSPFGRAPVAGRGVAADAAGAAGTIKHT